jgi:hypothetical protein
VAHYAEGKKTELPLDDKAVMKRVARNDFADENEILSFIAKSIDVFLSLRDEIHQVHEVRL